MTDQPSVEHTDTWTDLWAYCAKELGSSEESRRIVESVSGRHGASWLITLTKPATDGAKDQIDKMIERRRTGEPLQYVVGRWGFRQLDLIVDRRVLIPRPETEQVTEAALAMISEVEKPTVVDLGTGSGAIALSIALESPCAHVYATDLSLDALEVAAANLGELSPTVASRVRLLQGSWFQALPQDLKGQIDLVVSNPPYVEATLRGTLDRSVVDWEPEQALFAGDDGLDCIREIFAGVNDWLSPGGALVMEIGENSAAQVERLAWQSEFFSVQIGEDLAGRKRWVAAVSHK